MSDCGMSQTRIRRLADGEQCVEERLPVLGLVTTDDCEDALVMP